MGKLNRGVSTARTTVLGTVGPTTNADGLKAYSRDAKSELFLMAVGAFYGENKFYETDSESSKRFAELVAVNAKADPEWTAAFLVWLRTKANMRTASIVGAAEYVHAGAPNGRPLVRSVLVRADEPGELLAYWLSKYGRRIPQPIKRGVRDAVGTLYTERNAAKWDSAKAAVRFADVIELTHPSGSGARGDLYRYLIEERHGRATFEDKDLLGLRQREAALRSEDPREALLTEMVEHGNPTVTWETVSSAAPGKMTARQWELCYGGMGYMARLRNLRNLDQAGVDDDFKHRIGKYLADPAEVAKSRQLPMRFLSAYKAAPDLVWGSYLSKALDHSLDSVPEVPGSWLVLVDASGSMGAAYSDKSSMTYYEAACVFAAAFARRNSAEVRTFSNGLSGTFPQIRGESTLATVKRLMGRGFWQGGGTDTVGALVGAFNPTKHDHVLVLTDEVYNGYGWYRTSGTPGDAVPADIPMYTFNLAGYSAAQAESGPNRITVGGLSDAAFSMMAAVESTRGGTWPWEA